ncbi:purine-nucleoside phosphorylase [Desulfonatronovibrio hydrogenovorans]|uniref:purine-nucleoside phosphorylase n=1 Tax=Desulfonatronovibrio hydrogenovorans TaxID=53245 RepID=UPI0005539AAA|nr:purine-nucleoside phosphorylase [Desulfonatronovibrio hydrogenovorans]
MSAKTKVLETHNFLKKEFSRIKPGGVLVLGSGLGDLVTALNPLESIGYDQIPNFPQSTVAGHSGSLHFCQVNGFNLAVLSGRAHLYEGYSPGDVVLPMRVLGVMGAGTAIVTNAAGSLNPLFDSGQIMVFSDHINLTGENPLAGENVPEWGPRFPDMSRVYCPDLLNLIQDRALSLGIPLKMGVYVGIKGPSLETPAETRAFRILGGDAIGMSTVLEVICARHMNMRVLGLSCLTNKNLPDCMAETSHQEILEVAAKTNQLLSRLLLDVLKKLGSSSSPDRKG